MRKFFFFCIFSISISFSKEKLDETAFFMNRFENKNKAVESVVECKVIEKDAEESRVFESEAMETKVLENKVVESESTESAVENKVVENRALENETTENRIAENKVLENRITENKIKTLIFTSNPKAEDRNFVEYGIEDDELDAPKPEMFRKKMNEFLDKPLTEENLKEIKKEVTKYNKKRTSYLNGIVIDGLNIPKPVLFRKKMNKFLNEPLNMETLKKVKEEVVQYYREHTGYLVSVKILDGSKVTSGRVKIIVLEGILGKVNVMGEEYFSSKLLKNQIRIESGELIETNKIKEDLRWLNRNPFRNVSAVYAPGKYFRETDIELYVKDRFPLNVYGTYENTGVKGVGSNRFLAGFNYGNLFGLDQELNAQFMTTTKLKKWWGFSGFYKAPICFGHEIKILWSYVRSKPDASLEVNLRGKAWNVLGRYMHLLPVIGDYAHEMTFGCDFKRMNNFLSVERQLIYDDYMDIFQIFLKYAGSCPDRYGFTSFDARMFFSPGKITAFNKNKFFENARKGANCHYKYWTLKFTRATNFSTYGTWFLKGIFQISTGKLLPTEELTLGGYNTIRGYKEREVIGDKGFLVINELRTKIFNFTINRTKRSKVENSLQFLAFCDLGKAGDVDQSILSKHTAFLLSVGPGVRYICNERLRFRFDYGIQLKSLHGKIFAGKRRSRAHAGVTLSY